MSVTVLMIGSVGRQAYASVVEADNFLGFDSRYSAAWALPTNDATKKTQYLELATRLIDLYDYKGNRVAEDDPSMPLADRQTTKFPRVFPGETDAEGRNLDAYPKRSNGLHVAVEEACILLAGNFAANPPRAVSTQALPTGHIKRERLGPLETEYFLSVDLQEFARRNREFVRDQEAFTRISPFLLRRGTSGPFVFGTRDDIEFIPRIIPSGNTDTL